MEIVSISRPSTRLLARDFSIEQLIVCRVIKDLLDREREKEKVINPEKIFRFERKFPTYSKWLKISRSGYKSQGLVSLFFMILSVVINDSVYYARVERFGIVN